MRKGIPPGTAKLETTPRGTRQVLICDGYSCVIYLILNQIRTETLLKH